MEEKEKCVDLLNNPAVQDSWGRAFLAGASQALEWMRGQNGTNAASPSLMVGGPLAVVARKPREP